jgi:hypothetical protein
MKVHFKRYGLGNILLLQGLPDYYIESNDKYTYLKIVEIYTVPKVLKGNKYNETHHKFLFYSDYPLSNTKEENFNLIQAALNSTLNINVELENFIESYYIGRILSK